jgi:hypothetical protein
MPVVFSQLFLPLTDFLQVKFATDANRIMSLSRVKLFPQTAKSRLLVGIRETGMAVDGLKK